MGRKLKGKSNAKGLKAALQNQLFQQKLANSQKIKQQNLANGKVQLSKKAINQKARQQAKESTFVPFGKDETLLLVGEGDFSFAKSIIMQDYIRPENLIVSSYDASVNELKLKYPHTFEDNYKYLTDLGVKIFFQINATNLIKTFKLSRHTPWKKIMGKEWQSKYLQNIMFNFPHTGKGIKDQDRNIADHQELIFGYFDSAKQLFKMVNTHIKHAKSSYTHGYKLDDEEKDVNAPGAITEDGYGKIILSAFTGEPYDSWQIRLLAKKNGFVVDRSCRFQWSNYPEYHHKRTNSEQDTTKPAFERDARTYIFRQFAKRRPRVKEDADSDSD
ncbi:25S rRNA (uridine(2634)-N(3))-methyltransferase [Monosporozyma servazzii]